MKIQISKERALQIIKKELTKVMKLKVLKEQKLILENEIKSMGGGCQCEDKGIIKETGEWDESDEELVAWKNELVSEVERLSELTSGKVEFISVKGFDKYQGPYANVKINGKGYRIWTDVENGVLWIENYPTDNTSSENTTGGFRGTVEEIVDMLNGEGVDEGIGIGKSFTLKKSAPRNWEDSTKK